MGETVKQSNEYANMIPGQMYEDTPKAIFAAIAMSFALRLNDDGATLALSEIVNEWIGLKINGIVPQSPPAYLFKYIVERPDEE